MMIEIEKILIEDPDLRIDEDRDIEMRITEDKCTRKMILNSINEKRI